MLVEGCRACDMGPELIAESELESSATEGDSPVSEIDNGSSAFLSTTGHLVSCGKPGRPSIQD